MLTRDLRNIFRMLRFQPDGSHVCANTGRQPLMVGVASDQSLEKVILFTGLPQLVIGVGFDQTRVKLSVRR